MATDSVTTSKHAALQLGLRKGSRAAPILLLLLTVFLFVIHALPSGLDQLGESLKLTAPGEALTLTRIEQALNSESERTALWNRVKAYSGWEFVSNVGRPIIKAYVDQLFAEFGIIAASLLNTIWQLSLYSLIPGLAGLIYRRNFLVWFLGSFAILLAINASGVFGSLTRAQTMPLSGTIFFFLVTQLVLLMLAYRLRRHSQSLSLLPPRVQNWGLTALLVLVGIACWQGWGPGHTTAAGSTSAKAQQPAANESGKVTSTEGAGRASRAPSAQTPPSASAADTAAAPATSPAPEASPGTPTPNAPPVKSSDGPARSWIWSFLGSGFTGWIYKWEFILIGLPLIYTLLRNSAAWTARAPKNIVFCLDGTSNTPDQMEMGFLAQTNVFKLFNMLKADKKISLVPTGHFDASLSRRYGEKQIGLYYAGVGNRYDNDPILQTLGMATGMGAGDIIERAYLDLVRIYKPGDRVFIFGFSRGAAIARLLARTIDVRGAPRTVWTLRLLGKHRTLWTSRKRQPVPIDVLGCWDTVGSFGVAKTIAGINFQQLNMFKDLTIPDNVAQAYHMVALDEMRDSFEPTLMDPDPIRPERIIEVWFSGDHANIGGGWATDKLSDVTLDFLLKRVSSGYATDATQTPGDESWGIYLTAKKAQKIGPLSAVSSEDAAVVDPDPLGQVRNWFSNIYVYRPRKLPLHAVVSETVFERMTKSMPVYAPQSLFDLNDALDAKRDLITDKVAKLAETDSLDEAERKAVLEYKDRLRLTRWPKYWDGIVAERAPQPPSIVLSNARPVAQASTA